MTEGTPPRGRVTEGLAWLVIHTPLNSYGLVIHTYWSFAKVAEVRAASHRAVPRSPLSSHTQIAQQLLDTKSVLIAVLLGPRRITI